MTITHKSQLSDGMGTEQRVGKGIKMVNANTYVSNVLYGRGRETPKNVFKRWSSELIRSRCRFRSMTSFSQFAYVIPILHEECSIFYVVLMTIYVNLCFSVIVRAWYQKITFLFLSYVSSILCMRKYILGMVKRNPLFFHSISCKNNGFLFTTPNMRGVFNSNAAYQAPSIPI